MFDWDDFLSIAKRLTSDPDANEASQRSAISRAYYAVFNTAREYLIATNRISALDRRNIHQQLWAAMRAGEGVSEKRIAEIGFRLRAFRTRADYDAIYPGVMSDTRTAIEQAEIAIEELRRLSAT